MRRLLLPAVALVWATASAHAFTEQAIVDQLGEDLATTVVPLHRVVPMQQLSLTASLNLAGDRAQLSMGLALKALAADMAVASANLSLANADGAPAARQQYTADLSQAVAKYQQAVAQAYSGWTTRSAEAYQASQQTGSPSLQTGFQAVITAEQQAMESLLASDWGKAPPAVAPTLPDLSARVNEDAERVAEAEALIADARQTYLVDVNGLLAAGDVNLQTALALKDPFAMGEAMTDALTDLNQQTCTRYQQYETDVRSVLTSLNGPCCQ